MGLINIFGSQVLNDRIEADSEKVVLLGSIWGPTFPYGE